jgi:WNK lysine deficient protein kinase
LSASELLRDPFLETDDLASASLSFGFVSFHEEAEAQGKPTGGEGDTDRDRKHLLLTGVQTNLSIAISSSSYEEALVEDCWEWDWDRDRDKDQDQDNDENTHIEEAHRGISLFHGQEDEEEPIANLDISIKGKSKDDGSIFLRLRISDKDGTCFISSQLSLFFLSSFVTQSLRLLPTVSEQNLAS